MIVPFFSNCPDSIDLTRIQQFYILPDSSRFDRLEGISRSKLRITVDEKEWMIYGYSGISRHRSRSGGWSALMRARK